MALKKCKDCGNPVSSSAKACPLCGAPVRGRDAISSLARMLIIVFLIVPIGIGLFASIYESNTSTGSIPTPTTPTPPAISAAEKNANLEICRDKLKEATKLDLLADMSFDNGRPRVVVGPTWHQIDFSAKEGLARTAACFFLAGDSTKAIRFEITDGMTDKAIATWSYTKLKVK